MILVVDDETGVREITRSTLEAYGYTSQQRLESESQKRSNLSTA
jgi:hypothetical protein